MAEGLSKMNSISLPIEPQQTNEDTMNNHGFHKTAVMLIQYSLRIISLEEISEKKQTEFARSDCILQKAE